MTMQKFEGILICTDLDGTLLKNDKSISKENIEAIEYFKANGGKFTFITGRMPFFVSDIFNAIHPNAPIGCINGGGVYDCEKNEYLWTAKIADEVLELVSLIDENFPNVGIQVNTYYNVYFSKENDTMMHFRKVTNLENLVKPYKEVSEPISKIVFGSEIEEEILQGMKMLKEHPLADKFGFIRSEKALYEILPKNIGKGTAIEKLCELLGIDENKTIAIGDYDNDVSMLKRAKVGIAVSNASDRALKAADYVTVSNEENAVAKVIYDLENGKYLH